MDIFGNDFKATSTGFFLPPSKSAQSTGNSIELQTGEILLFIIHSTLNFTHLISINQNWRNRGPRTKVQSSHYGGERNRWATGPGSLHTVILSTSPEQPDTQRPEEQEEDLYSDITEVEYDYDEELYDEDESEVEARAVPTDPLGR